MTDEREVTGVCLDIPTIIAEAKRQKADYKILMDEQKILEQQINLLKQVLIRMGI